MTADEATCRWGVREHRQALYELRSTPRRLAPVAAVGERRRRGREHDGVEELEIVLRPSRGAWTGSTLPSTWRPCQSYPWVPTAASCGGVRLAPRPVDSRWLLGTNPRETRGGGSAVALVARFLWFGPDSWCALLMRHDLARLVRAAWEWAGLAA